MLPQRTSPSPGTVCGLSEPAPGTTLLWPSHVKDISSATDGGHLHLKWHFVNSRKLLHILPLLHFIFKERGDSLSFFVHLKVFYLTAVLLVKSH